jgi:hypothetical protein
MNPRGAGIAPPTLSQPFPIYLRYLLRAQFITNLRPEWMDPDTEGGFQVSKRGIEKGARGRKEQGDCAMYIVTCICVHNNDNWSECCC